MFEDKITAKHIIKPNIRIIKAVNKNFFGLNIIKYNINFN